MRSAFEICAHDGCSRGDARGPLHGLPVTVKSSIATAGYKCEIGSRNHEGEIPHEDAVVVVRLRAAGALILGTTNCPEFLMAYETDNGCMGRREIHGTWSGRRVDRAAESRRRLRRECRLRDWVRTAAGQCVCRRISRESVR